MSELKKVVNIFFSTKQKSLDPDQARRCIEPDLGLNCWPRLSTDDTSRQIILRPLMTFITIRVSNSLESDQTQRCIKSDLGPIYWRMSSTGDISRQKIIESDKDEYYHQSAKQV